MIGGSGLVSLLEGEVYSIWLNDQNDRSVGRWDVSTDNRLSQGERVGARSLTGGDEELL